ncbi:MAG: hypothetical protein ABIB46_05280 [bacterium]
MKKKDFFLLIIFILIFTQNCQKARMNAYDYQSELWPAWGVAGDFFPDKTAPNGQEPKDGVFYWTKEFYPEGKILIKGDVRIRVKEMGEISKPAKLVIGKGMKIIFMTGYDVMGFSGGWTNKSDLMIDGGILEIQGTKEEPVIFTSNGEKGIQKGDWGQISISKQYENLDRKSKIEYCLIEYATTGIRIINSTPDISNCIIRHIGHPKGQQYSDSQQMLYPGQGILCYYTQGNNFLDCSFNITNNEIYDCGIGIHIIKIPEGNKNPIPNPIITNNSIYDICYEKNLDKEANLYYGSIVLSNYSIQTWDGKELYKYQIVPIKENIEDEIYIYLDDQNKKKITGIIEYSNQSTFKIDAKNNWWGTIDKNEIKKGICDRLEIYDQDIDIENTVKWKPLQISYYAFNLGIVDFESFKTIKPDSPFVIK